MIHGLREGTGAVRNVETRECVGDHDHDPQCCRRFVCHAIVEELCCLLVCGVTAEERCACWGADASARRPVLSWLARLDHDCAFVQGRRVWPSPEHARCYLHCRCRVPRR